MACQKLSQWLHHPLACFKKLQRLMEYFEINIYKNKSWFFQTNLITTAI